jgi:hypothetical protein
MGAAELLAIASAVLPFGAPSMTKFKAGLLSVAVGMIVAGITAVGTLFC